MTLERIAGMPNGLLSFARFRRSLAPQKSTEGKRKSNDAVPSDSSWRLCLQGPGYARIYRWLLSGERRGASAAPWRRSIFWPRRKPDGAPGVIVGSRRSVEFQTKSKTAPEKGGRPSQQKTRKGSERVARAVAGL